MRRLEASLRRATPKGHETFISRTAPHQGLTPTSGPPCVQDTPRHAQYPPRAGSGPEGGADQRQLLGAGRPGRSHGAGLASLNGGDVRVVATRNFAQTVARATGNPSYTADRGGGVPAARTVTGQAFRCHRELRRGVHTLSGGHSKTARSPGSVTARGGGR